MKVKRKIGVANGEHSVNYYISYESSGICIFYNMEKFMIENSVFTDLFSVVNEEFLKANNIEYIKEENEIIPIGLIDFQNRNNKYSLDLMVTSKDELYKVPDILNSIEKAIKIKAKYFTFKEVVKAGETVIYETL